MSDSDVGLLAVLHSLSDPDTVWQVTRYVVSDASKRAKARIESLEAEKKNLTSYAAVLKKREGELERENAALKAKNADLESRLLAELQEPPYNSMAGVEAENAALREAQRWIPVTERLPETSRYVIAWGPKTWRGTNAVQIQLCGDYTDVWQREEWFGLPTGFTHWMPLPPPPEEQK